MIGKIGENSIEYPYISLNSGEVAELNNANVGELMRLAITVRVKSVSENPDKTRNVGFDVLAVDVENGKSERIKEILSAIIKPGTQPKSSGSYMIAGDK